MNKTLSFLRKNGFINEYFWKISPLIKRKLLKKMNDEEYTKFLFKLNHGYDLNLNKPQSLNEKIQYLKLFENDESLQIYVDKIKVKNELLNIEGADIVKTIEVFDGEVSKDDFLNIEPPFIIKSNHASGHYLIVRNKEGLVNIDIEMINSWLKHDHYILTREKQYKNIGPKIFVEELLLNDEGRVPEDFKFHCINGEVFLIQVDLDRENNHQRNLYNKNWEKENCTWSVYADDVPLYPTGIEQKKPDKLKEMIELSERIAIKFKYVRVDWYINNGKIYFGEITFHPGNGFERILPFKYDLKYGEILKI